MQLLQMHGCSEFNKFAVWPQYPIWWTATMQKWCALEKGPRGYEHMKKLFSSCYTHGVAHQLSWLYDTLFIYLFIYDQVYDLLMITRHSAQLVFPRRKNEITELYISVVLIVSKV